MIIEFAGLDNAGKTTQISILKKELKKDNEQVILGSKFVEFGLFPKTLKERQQWYRQAPIDEIVSTFLKTGRLRNKQDENKSSNIILYDRGHFCIYASCIARVMTSEKTTFGDAKDYVNEINSSIGYYPIEDIVFFQKFNDNPDQYLPLLEKREKAKLERGFKQYLVNFNNALNCYKNYTSIASQTTSKSRMGILNPYSSIDEIAKEVNGALETYLK